METWETVIRECNAQIGFRPIRDGRPSASTGKYYHKGMNSGVGKSVGVTDNIPHPKTANSGPMAIADEQGDAQNVMGATQLIDGRLVHGSNSHLDHGVTWEGKQNLTEQTTTSQKQTVTAPGTRSSGPYGGSATEDIYNVAGALESPIERPRANRKLFPKIQ